MKAYRTELIQVAAVAVAMIEDLDTGAASGGDLTNQICVEVWEERERQNEKWGPQHHDIPMWLAILMEEVGEASQAFLHVLEAAALTPGDTNE
jgi:hypothetical protein